MLKSDKYYETDKSSTIKCGECWSADVLQTKMGNYVGDEAVYESDLTLLLVDDDPMQCDDCLKQNEAYEELEID